MKLGTYRNTCLVISKLSPYLNEVRGREKVVYLNKEGRELIASDNEVKKSLLFEHMLLTNDAYIYFNRPQTWQREYTFESVKEPEYTFAIKVNGMSPKTKTRLVADAVFAQSGYVHLVEIDNTRDMKDNIKKIKTYIEMWPDIQKKFNMQPKLYFFTTTESRKRKLTNALKGMNAEVWTFGEIK